MTLKCMAILGIALLAAQAFAGEPQVPQTKKEKMSYAAGVDLGRNLKQLQTEIDLDLLLRGVRDGMSGETLLMTEKELFATRNSMQLEMRRKKSSEKMKRMLTPKAAGEKEGKPEEAVPPEKKR